jgi:hypothetical protein
MTSARPDPQENLVSSTNRLIRPRFVPAAGLATMALALAACGSGGGSTTSAASSPNPTSSAGTGRSGGSFASASGKATQLGSSGVKVATSSGTATVVWAGSTRFTKVATSDKSSLAVGDCVSVTSAPGNAGSSATSAPIKATTVTITGTSACAARTGPGGFGSGGSSGGTPFPRPSGAPTGRPGGGFGGPGGGFRGAVGTVTSVSNAQIKLKTIGFGSSSPTTSRTVTTTSATTYRTSATSTSSALAKGSCVSAIGSKTSAGVIDAFSITMSAPTSGTCPVLSAGFGSGPFGGGLRGRTGGTSQGGTTNA